MSFDSHTPLCAPSAGPLVLVAEDDGELRSLLADALSADGYRVALCRSGQELLEYFYAGDFARPGGYPELIVSDECMPGCTGTAALACLQRHMEPLPILLMTAFGDEAVLRRGLGLGATAVIHKPFDVDDFRTLVRTLV